MYSNRVQNRQIQKLKSRMKQYYNNVTVEQFINDSRKAGIELRPKGDINLKGKLTKR